MKYDNPHGDNEVPVNKLGIRDLAMLEKVEAEYYQIREQSCSQRVGEFKPTCSGLRTGEGPAKRAGERAGS